jgi:hypothetical protein
MFLEGLKKSTDGRSAVQDLKPDLVGFLGRHDRPHMRSVNMRLERALRTADKSTYD